MDPQEIRQIGPYPVRRFVAEGGMAWVYEVTDPRFDARRALKLLKPSAAAGQEFLRFQSEARLLAQLDHPNLVTIFDFGQDEETHCYYYTMTFVDGPTLSQRLAAEGRLLPEEAVPLFLNVLGGLAKLHAAEIVHRDIKPANVMITADGRALLGDLGIARSQEQSGGLTRTGTAIGTFLYMSPEQARGKPVGPQSDVFSMGLSLYEILTGQSVYDNVEDVDTTSGQEVLLYLGSLIHSGGELEIEFAPELGIPEPIQQVVKKACRFDPNSRYADAGELRAALEEAIRQPPPAATVVQPAVEPRRSMPLIPIAAGLALVAVAAIAWFLFGGQSGTEAEVELEQIAELEQASTAIVELVASFQPPPQPDLLAEARHELEVAGSFYRRGREDFEEKDYASVLTALELAREGYQRACEIVGARYLASAAQAAVKEVGDWAESLRKVRAAELSPARWPELEGFLAELSQPVDTADACIAADTWRSQLAVADQATALTLAVEQDLEAEWPRLAGVARDAAVESRTAAIAFGVDSPEFEISVSRGDEGLAEGDALQSAGDHLSAQEAYRRAQEAFSEAERVAPAALALAQIRGLEQEALRRGIRDVGPVSRVISEADELYGQGKWQQAADSYGQAKGLFQKLFENVERSAEANETASAADAMRASALLEGADRTARASIEKGDELREAATLALEEGWFDEAELQFQSAQKAYASAKKEATVALEKAVAAGRDARSHSLASSDCAGLGPAPSDVCRAARAALGKGDEAIEARDIPTALSSYLAARDGFDRAKEAQKVHLANLPRPPALVGRTPVSDRVKVSRNDTVLLSVEATDPNGDPLRYAWSANGRRLEETGSELELRAQESGRIAVEVDDGQGGSFTEQWRLDVENRKPNLSVSPRERKLVVTQGESVPFEALAQDADGDEVRIEFLVDGELVGAGPRFTYRAQKAGRRIVLVRATDAGGATTELSRELQVKPEQVARVEPTPPPTRQQPPPRRSEPPPPTRREPTPPPPPTRRETPPPTQTTRAKPPPTRVERAPHVSNAALTAGARAALEEYEAAYEARDVDRLAKVWLINSQERRNMSQFFSAAPAISVSIQEKNLRVEQDQVVIDFDQQVSPQGMKTAKAKLRATLVRRGPEQWAIKSLKPR